MTEYFWRNAESFLPFHGLPEKNKNDNYYQKIQVRSLK